jgi:hypothetical protein
MNAATIKADLLERHDRIQQWWIALDNVKQLYVASMIMAGLFVATIPIAGIGLLSDVFLTTATTTAAIAFVIEGYRWLVAKLEAPLAKWLTGIAGVMAAALATGAASATLAVATGQDPSAFNTATAFLAPLSFVPILATLIIAGGLLVLIFCFIGSLAKHSLSRAKLKRFDVLLLFARGIGIVGVSSAASQVISPPMQFNDGLEATARYSAFFLDMVPDRTCAPTEGDRVARINDSLVIIARMTDDGLQFVRKDCAITAERTSLWPPKLSRGK